MKTSLKPGLEVRFAYRVPEDKTVPHLLPESSEMQIMPNVLATGFMIGIVEWACIQAIMPHIDWPREQTVGIGVDLTHIAPTPPGLTVTVHGELVAVEGRRLTFTIRADDGIDQICSGTHDRSVIDAQRFNSKAGAKLEAVAD